LAAGAFVFPEFQKSTIVAHRGVVTYVISLADERVGGRGETLMQRNKLAVAGHFGPLMGEALSTSHALSALAALGQSTRLDVCRLLMRREPNGLSAGAIAEAIGCPQNTLSAHLSILARAGLVRGTRDGRSIVYRADVNGIRALIDFLVHDCCDGHPELCRLTSAPAASDDGCNRAGGLNR
jgi:DNA-binding transcriptional ArsR family regulator